MNRRKSLKTLGLSTISASLLLEAFKSPGPSVIKKEELGFLPNLKSTLLNNKNKGKLIFTFVSLAYTGNAKEGFRKPIVGMNLLAEIAHRYNIPVTWLIDLGTGSAMKNKLDEWHHKYGDDIGVAPTGEKERDSLIKLFPWSKVTVLVETTHKGDEASKAKELGFSAIWGSCWEQVGIDGITDRGTPWGCFYVSDENYKIPAVKGKGLVSLEWTSRDLLKALHSGGSTIYSSDAFDVTRAGLCTGDDITYWKALFDNYIRNIASNKFVFFQQQLESHEMIYDAQYKDICTPAEIDMDAKVTDAFFGYVKSFGDLVEYKTLPEAVQLYTDNFSETEPSVMLFDDVPVKEIQFWYGRDNCARGPWPKTLLYYDKECQLAFIEGKFEPFLVRDYIHNRRLLDPAYYRIAHEDEPEVKVNIPWEPVELTEVPVEIKANKEIPYAVTFWYDFNRYKIKNVEGAELVGPIENQVALLRLNLKKGINNIVIHLEKL